MMVGGWDEDEEDKEKEDHSVGYVFKIEKEETPTEW